MYAILVSFTFQLKIATFYFQSNFARLTYDVYPLSHPGNHEQIIINDQLNSTCIQENYEFTLHSSDRDAALCGKREQDRNATNFAQDVSI